MAQRNVWPPISQGREVTRWLKTKRAHGPHDDKSKTARFGREERAHRAHAPEAGTFLGAAFHLPSVMPAEHASNRACARYERRIISVTMAATWAA